MNNSKHTKGEWKISGSGHTDFDVCVTAEDGGSVCFVSRWREATDNAELIAKSPKMYEAIKKALSVKELWANPIVNSAGERAILEVILKQFEESIS